MRLRRGTRTLTAVAHASSWLKARRRCQVCIAAASLVAVLGGAVVAVPVAAQDIITGDDAEVRIVARSLESGRVEFGLQQRQADNSWGNRQLPRVRFFPTTATVGRWLASSAISLPVGEVRVVARSLESGRVEFGLQQRQADNSWGNRQLPRVRFFPTTARVGRWLASSPLTVTAFPIADADSGAIADGRPQQGDGSYRDVRADAPYAEAVAALAEAGVFAGTWCDDGFCPDDPIDRKTMAVWLVRLFDGEDPPRASEPRFRDVNPAGFHAPFIERLAVVNLVTGCRPARFSSGEQPGFGAYSSYLPHHDVTRAQAVAIVAGYFCFPAGVPDPGFSDVAPSAWYADHLDRAVAWGGFEGCDDGSRFCPDRSMTRAEMATALWRAESPEHPRVPPDEQPRQVSVELTGAMDGGGVISGGLNQTCALRYDQTVVCWGLHFDYRLNFPPFRFQSVSSGSGPHSCGVRVDQTLACWGGTSWTRHVYVDGPPRGEFASVAAGGLHSCGIRIEGTIECWWTVEYYDGQAQDFGQADAPSGSFTAVSAGNKHSCGVRADQRIICWGDNRRGLADAPSGSFTAVSVGQDHSCGLRSDGTVACWGDNEEGQTDAPSGRFTAVSAGRRHSCGIRIDQSIACWGNNSRLDGIRSGSITNTTWHVTFAPSGRFIAVSAGVDVPCAVSLDGTVECWGTRSGGYRDPSNAVWGAPPEVADCPRQPVSGARPGRPASAQVVTTGAVDDSGLLIQPAILRWGRPCGGGRVDHYVVQWRRGYEDFAADRQRVVDATDTTNTYSLKLRDRLVYAVRVTAVNTSGRTSSAEVIVPTPANEVRTIAELLVSTYQDRVPWLADVWQYMKQRRYYILASHCGREVHFNRYSVSCVQGGAMQISYPFILRIHGILLHEMAHIYFSFLFRPERNKSRAAALAAGLLYLRTSFPECDAPELLADMPLFVMPPDKDDLYTGSGVHRWVECSTLITGSGYGLWDTEEFGRVQEVARSVFVDQEIPQWFYDTYQRADGTWDLDTIRSALGEADQQLDTSSERGIRAALRTFIPEL